MSEKKRDTKAKIELFKNLFRGLENVYGTYNLTTKTHYQVRKPVTDQVIYQHLKGIRPYGFYPLIGTLTRIGAADFDDLNPEKPVMFCKRAAHHKLHTYMELSKSKGWHVWMFFDGDGADARKVRTVINMLLDEIESTTTEIFPKQDAIDTSKSYGNFINAPLFGKLVKEEQKTVFVETETFTPYPNQWDVLESIQKINEATLDEITEINGLTDKPKTDTENKPTKSKVSNRYGLPPCIRTILEEGVTYDQRVACFRMAIHLKRIGIPLDIAMTILKEWGRKNQPENQKRIITPEEIELQTQDGYKEKYTGYGCDVPVIRDHCTPECPVRKAWK